MKFLLCLIALFSVSATVLVIGQQVQAESTILFNFNYDGESPNSHGERINDWIPEYVYEFEVTSDEQPITSIAILETLTISTNRLAFN